MSKSGGYCDENKRSTKNHNASFIFEPLQHSWAPLLVPKCERSLSWVSGSTIFPKLDTKGVISTLSWALKFVPLLHDSFWSIPTQNFQWDWKTQPVCFKNGRKFPYKHKKLHLLHRRYTSTLIYASTVEERDSRLECVLNRLSDKNFVSTWINEHSVLAMKSWV